MALAGQRADERRNELLARKRGVADAKQQQERGRTKASVHAIKRKGLLAITLSIIVLIGLLVVPVAAPAKTGHCGAVVKKLVSYPRAEFYKAKVFTNGRVPCSQARRIIWRAIQPGGFDGGLAGWQCQSKGNYDPLAEKCVNEAGGERRVAKSSKPKYCRGCHRNVKRAVLMAAGAPTRSRQSAGGWRHCGRVHYWRDQYPLVESKRVRCGEARRVARAFVYEVRHRKCLAGICHPRGFTCSVFAKHPGEGQYCHRDAEIVRMRIPARER